MSFLQPPTDVAGTWASRPAALALVLLAGLAPGSSPRAAETRFGEKVAVETAPGHRQDLYTGGQQVSIRTPWPGDVAAFAQTFEVTAPVDGDLFVFAQNWRQKASVGDSIRAFVQNASVERPVDGDLIVFGQSIVVGPDSVIRGDAVLCGQSVTVEGEVQGNLRVEAQRLNFKGRVARNLKFTGGEVSLDGTVAGDADITCDTVTAGPDARIEGDLVYAARVGLGDDADRVVGGTVEFKKREPKPEKKKREGGGFGLFRILSIVSSFLVGFVLLALLRPWFVESARSLNHETWQSLVFGFLFTVATPLALLLVALLIVTLPLSLMGLAVYLMALYLAKYPLSLALGRRLLGLVGAGGASPFAGLLVGLVLFHVLVALPSFLGSLAQILALIFGVGSLILGARRVLAPSAPAA